MNEHAHPASSSENTPWFLVLLLIGSGVVASFQVGKAPPVLTAMRHELGMSLFLSGWILSTFNIIGLTLGSASGAAADGLGHRRLLILGLSLQGLGSLYGGLTHQVPVLFMTRVLEGLGFLMVAVSAPSLIFMITRSRDLRLALAGWSCFLPAGASIIMLIAPLVTDPYGWRGLWILNALILGGYTLFTAACTKGLSQTKGPRRITLLKIVRDTVKTSTSIGPLLLALIFSTYTMRWLAMMGFLPTLLMEEYGLTQNRASVLTAIVVAVNVPGNLAGGWLMSRGARRWQLIMAVSLTMGLLSLFIYAQGLPFGIRYTSCLLFTGIGGILPASLISGAPVHAPSPDLVAATNGMVMQGSQLGQLAGPPALAYLVTVYGGWQASPWLHIGSAVLGILLAVWLAVLERGKE